MQLHLGSKSVLGIRMYNLRLVSDVQLLVCRRKHLTAKQNFKIPPPPPPPKEEKKDDKK